MMEEGYVLDAFAVNYAQHLIVCGVHGKSSRILVYQYGVAAPLQIIEGAVALFALGHPQITFAHRHCFLLFCVHSCESLAVHSRF